MTALKEKGVRFSFPAQRKREIVEITPYLARRLRPNSGKISRLTRETRGNKLKCYWIDLAYPAREEHGVEYIPVVKLCARTINDLARRVKNVEPPPWHIGRKENNPHLP